MGRASNLFFKTYLLGNNYRGGPKTINKNINKWSFQQDQYLSSDLSSTIPGDYSFNTFNGLWLIGITVC